MVLLCRATGEKSPTGAGRQPICDDGAGKWTGIHAGIHTAEEPIDPASLAGTLLDHVRLGPLGAQLAIRRGIG